MLLRLQVLEGLRVAALADDLDLVGEAGGAQGGRETRAQCVAHGQHDVVDLRMAAQVGHDPVGSVLAQRRHRDVERRVLAVGAVLLVRALELVSERLQDLEGGDVDEERVGLAVAVGDDLGREVLADLRAVPLVRRRSRGSRRPARPRCSTSRTPRPASWPARSAWRPLARLTALRITASAPWRSAVLNAFWSCSGEPSVPIVEAVQPRSAAPCLMMSPWISQASTPQLMKTTFLPVGTGLPIGCREPDARRPRGRLLGQRLRLGHAGASTALSGRAAVESAAASGRRDERGAENEKRRAFVRAVPQAE